MGEPDPIVLGSFQLLEPLAEGGMGQVWSARHVSRAVDAAVKVIGAHGVGDVRAAVLLAEVHSAARLSHPNIVAVYDAGLVDEQASATSSGRLQVGGPWYAMERVDGEQIGRAPWSDLRRWLLQLLDALGHAHARGVVHRDLKPSNVLIDSASDVRLVDFGMALSVDPSDSGGADSASASNPLDGGTPTWMAPEQFSAPRSLHGPWTDLYAVGLLAWALACGRAPYQARSTWRLMRMHLQEPLPTLAPVTAVPRGLEAWIRRCAAKSPADRYPRAVDAARALQALGSPVGVDGTPAPVVDGDTPTVQTARHLGHRVQVWQPAPAEPIPPTWRQVQARPRPVDPAVLGLQLTRLRELPVAGREEEQDALWEALRDAAVGPRLVVLEGDAGVGKSRLVRWLARAVHSLGLGQPILASGDPSRPDDAAAIVKRALALADERPADLDEVLEARLGPELAARVRPLVAPRDGEAAVPVAEGVRMAAAVAVRLAGHRLPLLIVDDAQWSAVGLALADTLLDEGRPALVLLTVRVDAVDDDPQNAQHLDVLRERGDTLHVAPLQPDATRDLLHSVGALDPGLAHTLEERAGGNPLFLLELVADWAARGVLAPGDAGWSLTVGASVPLPAGLAALWTERVEQLLASGPATWEGALELAAVLGGAVDGAEWAEACATAGVPLDGRLLPTLVAQGLAVHEPGTRGLSWRLSHGMLRESLVERAERGGRLQAWDRAAAAMLEPRGRRLAARRARHLERAGDRDAAVDAWLRAAAWLHEVDQRQALRVTERAALLLEDSPDDDPRRDRLLYTRGRSLAFQSCPDEAAALADALLERGRRRDSPGTEGCGHMLWAILHRTAWDAAGAVEAAERALACMQRLEVPENRVAEAWAELGFARFSSGDFAGAEEAFRHSGHTAFIPPMKVQADLLRSHCYHQLGDVARARRVLERTVNRIPPGSDLMRAGVEVITAELERHEGRTDEALKRVLAAIAASERRYRVPQARVVGLLAELWIDAGRPDRARRVLEQYDHPGRRDALEWVSAEALVAAVSGDTATLDEVLSCIEADRSAQAVIAIARRLERTADRALGLDRGLAARAGALAVAAWERAHRASDADRVRAALWATGLGSDRPVG